MSDIPLKPIPPDTITIVKGEYSPLNNISIYAEKLGNISSQELLLMCGEMTAQEIRTCKAVLRSVSSHIKGLIK